MLVSFVDQSQIDNYKECGMEEDELKRYKVADNEIKNKTKTAEWANAIIYILYQNYNSKKVDITAEITSDAVTEVSAPVEPDHKNLASPDSGAVFIKVFKSCCAIYYKSSLQFKYRTTYPN